MEVLTGRGNSICKSRRYEQLTTELAQSLAAREGGVSKRGFPTPAVSLTTDPENTCP